MSGQQPKIWKSASASYANLFDEEDSGGSDAEDQKNASDWE